MSDDLNTPIPAYEERLLFTSPEPSQNKILADGLYANERQRAKHFITQSRAAFVVSVYGVVAFTGVTFLFMAIYPDFSNAPVRWMGLSNDLRLMITVALAGFMGALVRQNLQFSRIIENQKTFLKRPLPRGSQVFWKIIFLR